MISYDPVGAGATQLRTVRVDGTVLAQPPIGDPFPIIAPDGRRLAFTQPRFAGDPRLAYRDLYVMTPLGTFKRRIVRGGQVRAPDWQPLPRRAPRQ